MPREVSSPALLYKALQPGSLYHILLPYAEWPHPYCQKWSYGCPGSIPRSRMEGGGAGQTPLLS